MRPSPVRQLRRVCTIFLCLGLCACAAQTRFERLLVDTKSLEQASIFFGKPDKQAPLPDGTVRSDWLMHRTEQVPGQWVEREVTRGRDRDGFPVVYIERYFVPPHMTTRTCTLTILSTAAGSVVSTTWNGNSCDSLLSADRQNYEEMSKAKQSMQSLQEGFGPELFPWF